MSNILSFVKRAISVTVASMTILSSIGLAAFAPVATQAASAGDLIKQSDLSSVYYYGADGNRYTFPNATTYNTWYTDFSTVKTIPATELQSIRLAGNVTFRPGTYLVKITTDPAVYAVEPGGVLRWITTESIAQALYGPTWASMVRDVPDGYFPNYSFGSDITTNKYPTGTVISHGGDNWYVSGNQLRKITSAGFSANKFQSKFVVAGNASIVGTYTFGSDITGVDTAIWNVAGGATNNTPVANLSVSLASTNPAPSVLVSGATTAQATADLAHFSFMGTGTVTAVTLKRLGVSADSTLSNIYLFDGVNRLTDAASISSNGTVTISNPNGLFTVSGSKTISVKSDLAAGASGQTVGIQLTSYTAGGPANSVSVSGNIHSIASATLATVDRGTVTPSGSTLNPGAGVTVWQSTLTVAQEDVLMKRISFRNTGSATASAFSGFKLFVNGVQVGTASTLDANGYVTFDFTSSPVRLDTGARIVRLDADIVSGASRTVQFSMRQAADVDFVDASYGVNITPSNTPWAPSSASTISGTSGGTLTIEKDVTSPSVNVVNNGSDVVLGVFKVTAYGEPIKLENLRVAYTGSANIADDADSLRNGRVLINGAQYGSTASLNETTDTVLAYTQFTINYTVYPGTPVLVEVRADVYDNGGDNDIVAGTDTVTAVIAAGSSNAQRLDSLGTFSAPSGAVTANQLSIASGSLTLSENTTYTDQNVQVPQTNAKIGSWNLAGSSVQDVLLTTLSFDVDEVSGTTFNESDLTNMYVVVKNGSTVVAQPSPISTVGAADNNFSINYTLPKNQSVSIELFANIGSTVTVTESFKTDLTVSGTSLISGSAVTATSADTDGQTIAYAASYIQAAVDASSPTLTLVSDQQTVTTGAFKFTSVNSGFNVTDLTLTLPTAASTIVQSVMLYDGTTLVAAIPMTSTTTAVFSGLAWTVPANTSKVLTVKLQLGTVGTSAGTTGAALTTELTVFTSVSTSTGSSDASAPDSGQSREASANPTAQAHYVHAAFPTISQGTVSTTLTNAVENDMYKFVVTPVGGPVSLKQLKFTVVVNDNVGTNDTLTVGSFKLFRGSTDITSLVDIHNTAGATIESTNTLAEGTSTAIVTWATEESISSATEFTLKATPSGFATSADDDYVSITMAYDSSAQTAGNVYLVDLDSTTAQVTVGLQNAASDAADGTIGATVTTGPNVVWSDLSALPHSETVTDDADGTQDAETSSADWRNGYLIQSLPLSGITKNN